VEIINDHFNCKDVIKQSPLKWFNYKYGINTIRTVLMLPYSRFSSFYGNHVCNSFLKSTFEEVWKNENDVLRNTCIHKFRTRRDVNQWLVREWQLASSCFYPISPKRGRYITIKNNNDELFRCISKKEAKVLCINDNGQEPIKDFEKCRAEILNALDATFPEKSIFEK